MDILKTADTAAGWFVAAIFTVSTGASTFDSYAGLRAWALEHGDTGVKADLFPLFIDAFALAAEAFMFRASLRGWGWGAKIVGWLVAGAGLALSIALNVGQLHSSDWLTQGTQGVAPLAAFFSLLVGSIMFEESLHQEKIKADEAEQAEQDALPDTPVPPPVAAVETLQAEYDGLFASARETFAEDIQRGHLTGVTKIKKHLHVGDGKAPLVQAHLAEAIRQQAIAA